MRMVTRLQKHIKMVKGRDLLGYAVNEMGGDKLMTLYKIADEMLDLDDITRRAISLINPYNQYCFLEEIILLSLIHI